LLHTFIQENPVFMKKFRSLLFYVLVIGAFSLLVYFILHNGQRLETNNEIAFAKDTGSAWDHFRETYAHNLKHPLAILLLQIVTIIIVARIFGFLFRKIGQPSVIGEIVAGIILGPSLIGMYFPEFSGFLFPKESLGNLQFLSQIGLILFMFIVGMELDIKVLQKKAHEAVVISHASIILPFALGMGFAYFTYRQLAPPGINFMSFGLFMGIAMSITAFPVLARIVQEKGLMKTKLGNIAITCAAADDITAWCILAVVIAIVKAGSFVSSLYTILMAIAYVFLMWKVVRPFFKRMGEIYTNRESVSKPVVGIFFIMLIVSAYVCELIGIHALFGAFMAGMIMPTNVNFRSIFIEKVEDVALVLLLPLFFVFTGLRTQLGLLNDASLWGTCFIIIVVAVTGKFVGSALAAKIVGQTWRESLIIGSLMNTRGLVELVVLNIGYDLGVLNPQVFTMMVIMALITTFMTGPALALINKLMPEYKGPTVPDEVEHGGKYKILISFSNPKKAKAMLRLAHSLVKRSASKSGITAMHLSPSTEINQYNSNEYERENFLPIKAEAKKLGLPLVTMFKPSQDVNKEITETANAGNYDMLLIGVGNSVFEGTLLGKILGFTTRIITPERLYETIIGKERLFEETIFDEGTRQVLRNAKVPVGVFIDKDLEKADRIFIPVFSISDSFLLIYAQKLIQNNEAQIIILDACGVIKQNAELKETIRSIEQTAPNHIALFSENKLQKDFLEQQDLMIISMDSWKKAVETQSVWLSDSPSTLIIKP
jgi:Kef-type K+ transport system membrane component KefB